MVSRNYYLSLILGILIICLTALTLGYFIGSEVKWYIFPLFILILIEISLLVRHLNTINRKIASFFNAILNEDTAIHLTEKSDSKLIRDLNVNMNRVAHRFREIRIESEFREQLFQAMIEHSSTGFISIDEHGDFEIMNETSRNILGVAYTSNMYRVEKEFPELYDIIRNIRPRQIRSCKIETPNQTTIVQVSASVLKFRDKKLTLISLQDIKKEIELKELESWQKLIRIMNHEIMNSIAPITSVSKSLIKIYRHEGKAISSDKMDDKKIRDTISGLDVIESMSTGLSQFVNSYRQLSQIPKPVLQPIELEKWTVYLKKIGEEIAPDAEIRFHVQKGIRDLTADEKLLNQVMLNLIKNAGEAPFDHGKKVIEIGFEKTLRNTTQISVQNNGIPIEPEVMDKIFIPFFTTKENGAGIGLFLSRQILSLHQGTISVLSNEKEGTKFIIEL